ncbi:MAG: tRNA uridine-5-carboxymethylaminomethyl(34) synthesis enzyme MnmG [Deltaproteobacteria bacterium]|nr:tRNA uridine-5-carboxymethylaminomethyl(34) synthesis enzyme MnmG [Deltaproteobacteria bacterium]MBI3293743.1 tRNA uridine-5-carboxymethylaminomethyl(34) synthesis enzyme MnmG [Deltaproteobacteria bacterium]
MFHVEQRTDIIVIGGGHAGCEAALAAAKLGCSVALVTMRSDKIAEMSCNPSIGGVGKGQLVKEIDALGGEMGRNADWTGIQFKRLNTRKGSAVQSSRCQSDKAEYARRMQGVMLAQKGVTIIEAEVKALVVEGGRVRGLECFHAEKGRSILMGGSVVLTAGTFMRAVMHCGARESEGGRYGEPSSNGLSDSLVSSGMRILRLKTGTPARLLKDSINWAELMEQPGDNPPRRFSFYRSEIALPQVPCFLGYTNSDTHRVIRDSLHLSPLYSGKISGIGPRYCPSIEDKVVKFPDKEQHHVFFEPESLSSDWIYPNGISTSLPAEVQEEFIRTLPGCRDVRMARPGYAVEYDCLDPSQLDHSFQVKAVEGLFTGGQVNGTSGYEEAGAQGLFAGVNAALWVQGRPPLRLDRSESYIGVMVDDLVTKGITEPYRMFTSRCEYRLSIREDNADLRLSPKAMELGLLCGADRERFLNRKREIESGRSYLRSTRLKPTERVLNTLVERGLPSFTEATSLQTLLKRPEIGLDDIEALTGYQASEDPNVCETLEIETKYLGYIAMQSDEIARLARLAKLLIPVQLDFTQVPGLSREIVERLGQRRPSTIAEAARVSGVTPAALTAIVVHLKKGEHVHPQ